MPTAAGSALDADEQAGDPAILTTIELSRVVTQHGGAVWQALTSPAGTAVWLGEGAVLGARVSPTTVPMVRWVSSGASIRSSSSG